jgi:hypothetical protein
MPENLQDRKPLTFNYGMSPDTDPLFFKEGKYKRAINTVLNSHLGNTYTVQNEPSNFLCLNAPYTVIGSILLPNGKHAIFSTDDTNSEIGLFDNHDCSYTTVVNASCLNFNKANLIRGVAKENFDCSYSIYWVDNGRNTRRFLNLSDIPYTYTELNDACKTKNFTNQLDCEALNISSKVSYPCISLELDSDGNLKNGAYQAAISYTINRQRVTNFLGVTTPVNIFSHENFGRSLVVSIDNLDRDFEEYELAIVWTQQGVTSVERIGYYSTAQSKVIVNNVGNTAVNQSIITLDELLAVKPYYETADDICATSQYLMFVNPKTRKELNYQPQALDIESRWVLYKVPANYYRNGGANVGYMRDEVYSFGIQWLYDTGDWSPVEHIPGRPTTIGENGFASGADAFENRSVTECDDDEPVRIFEVKNTASLSRSYTSNATPCEEEVVAEGTMGYHESTELYPDNEFLYGDLKCKPIRHHKFPDNAVAPLQDGCDNNYIYILGVKFDNIQPPVDENGQPIPGIVKYRIVRGNRQGNRSVIGKGLLFNTGEYEEAVYNGDNRKVLYANYPYNDLRVDPFISKKQTKNKVNKEYNYSGLDTFSKNKFTFHSPSFSFNNPTLGNELKIESEQVADVTGRFEPVYKHPKHKLITNTAATLAIIMGAAEATTLLLGQRSASATRTLNVGLDAGVETTSGVTRLDTTFFRATSVGLGVIPLPKPLTAAFIPLGLLFYTSQSVDTFINFIQDLSSWQTYAYQYNSHGVYCKTLPVFDGNKRRRISYYQYLLPGIQTVNGARFNNYNRESAIYLELAEDLENPSTVDNTRNTIRGFNLCNNPQEVINTTASSYYGAVKRRVVNQYGQIDSIQYLATDGCAYDVGTRETPVIFGGDSYVNRFSVKRKMPFFNNTLFDVQNGFEWDYRSYRNVGYPRFWADHTAYDGNEMARLKVPSEKHNLDCSYNIKNVFVVKNRYYYLYNSGIVDFYVESEYNLDYRDWDDTINGRHYDRLNYTDLSELFRSDRIAYDNKYLFNRDYLKQLTENTIIKHSRDYDPSIYSSCFTRFDNRVVYSLPQTRETVKDNWRVFLYNDYYDFSKENGQLTAVRNFDRDQFLFLFDRSSPYFTLGLNTLSTEEGNSIILGSGSLFVQQPQRLLYTDFGYGNCQSRFAFVNTQFGLFYPSQRQGRIFIFTGRKLEEISREDMNWWFKANMPSKLLGQFPAFIHKDNPVIGVGLLSTFDNTNEIYYLSKRDFAVKEEYINDVTYLETTNQFYYKGTPIKLGDATYFEDASWTISYDYKLKAWISFHDWHPSATIQTENHFITVKDNSLWKHNERCDSYCKFYGVDHPWEIELVINNSGKTEVLHSLEWILEAYQYSKDCYDPYHNLTWNFDEAYVFNTEQNSGLLRLNLKDKKKITDTYKYPEFKNTYVNVAFDKVEQSYRLNQFIDLTNDRKRTLAMWDTTANGYRRVLNLDYIDFKKNLYERKKFRHNWHSVILRRTISDNVKGILKLELTKQTLSPR